MIDSGPRYLANEKIFLLSLLSVLSMNTITVLLTWQVVFEWKIGFEYNPSSLLQLATYGPLGTLIITQLTLLGVFLFVRTGLAQIAKTAFRRSVQVGKITNQSEIQSKYRRISSQYRRILNVVLLTIVAIIALDLVNDLTQFLRLFLH